MTFLGCALSEVRILRGLRYRAGSADKLIRAHGVDAAHRIRNLLKSVQDIDESLTVKDVLVYKNIERIDAGEQVLFASACRDKQAMVLTGDKKCMRALASTPSLAAPLASLQGRIICFEHIVLGLIYTIGFECVQPKFVAGADCDENLKKIFTPEATEVDVIAKLNRSIDSLVAETSGLLCDRNKFGDDA